MRSSVSSVFMFCLLAMAGCDSTADDDQGSGQSGAAGLMDGASDSFSAGAGGGAAGDGGDAAGSSGADGSAEVRCTGGAASFPNFDRACWESEWCTIAFHQVDCCGNRVALGILHPELEHFQAVEAVCQAQYPACGCPSGPTRTDTGQMASDEAAIKVECRAGICTSYVP